MKPIHRHHLHGYWISNHNNQSQSNAVHASWGDKNFTDRKLLTTIKGQARPALGMISECIFPNNYEDRTYIEHTLSSTKIPIPDPHECSNVSILEKTTTNEECCTRSRYQGQGQVITSHDIYGTQVLIPSLDICFWPSTLHMWYTEHNLIFKWLIRICQMWQEVFIFHRFASSDLRLL